MSLKVGQEAPDFSATAVYDQEFNEITLSGLIMGYLINSFLRFFKSLL